MRSKFITLALAGACVQAFVPAASTQAAMPTFKLSLCWQTASGKAACCPFNNVSFFQLDPSNPGDTPRVQMYFVMTELDHSGWAQACAAWKLNEPVTLRIQFSLPPDLEPTTTQIHVPSLPPGAPWPSNVPAGVSALAVAQLEEQSNCPEIDLEGVTAITQMTGAIPGSQGAGALVPCQGGPNPRIYQVTFSTIQFPGPY